MNPLVGVVLVLLVFVKYLTPPFFIIQDLLILNLCNVFVFKVLVEPVFDLADSSPKQRLHLGDLRPLRANFVVHE